ncbi:MAG: phenylalanine--tRNA ligase subunit alpha [archaeon]|nr:phenylalanine--tRNA ligase subunit alpha [archaeon]
MVKTTLKENSLKVIKELKKLGNSIEARELCANLKMEYEVLMTQAIFELQQEKFADYSEKQVTELKAEAELKEYVKNGLPERQLFNFLKENNYKEIIIDEFKALADLEPKIFFIGLSNMKKNRWVVESKAVDVPTIYIYDENGPQSEIEKLVEKFKSKSSIILEELPKKLQDQVKILLKRKLIQKHAYTSRVISLTKTGKSLDISKIELKGEEIARISSDMISDGSWKDNILKLKPFEVENAGPRLNAGKLHPMTILMNRIREIFLSMGFTEIKGPLVELAFYNFDSLYQPQDHPSRELHDTFYLSNPAKGKLPEKKYIKNVCETHENGGKSGSKGWRYKWDEEISKKTLLRTHTTATTIRRLSKVIKDKDTLPLKVFSIDRVFRNESVDRTHLAEFIQVEGIVIGENVNLCQLRGILTEFYQKMGFPKIITRPGFFPYTEPSMEIAVLSKEFGWIEMGGSGIFRPEVTYPWGIEEPLRVLAWGQGFERQAMQTLERKDIRDLYRSPLSWLRNVKYTKGGS